MAGIALIFFLVVGTASSCHAIKVSSVEEDEAEPAARELFRTFNIHDETTNYSLDVTYPQIQDPVADAAIREFVDGWLDTIKQESAENAAGERGIPYNLFIRFEHTRFSPEIMSFVFYIQYYAGGAHDFPSMWSFTFDLSASREIMLANIITDTDAALAVISRTASEQVVESLGEFKDTLDPGGLAPFAENFSVFTIEDNGIMFYFPPSQAAPYAAGMQSAFVHFGSDIKPLLAAPFQPLE